MRGEDLLGSGLGHTVRQRELEVLLDELLQVGALDVGSLLDLDDLENLFMCSVPALSQFRKTDILEKTYVD